MAIIVRNKNRPSVKSSICFRFQFERYSKTKTQKSFYFICFFYDFTKENFNVNNNF